MVLSLEDRCVLKVSEKLFGITWRETLSHFRRQRFNTGKELRQLVNEFVS